MIKVIATKSTKIKHKQKEEEKKMKKDLPKMSTNKKINRNIYANNTFSSSTKTLASIDKVLVC